MDRKDRPIEIAPASRARDRAGCAVAGLKDPSAGTGWARGARRAARQRRQGAKYYNGGRQYAPELRAASRRAIAARTSARPIAIAQHAARARRYGWLGCGWI